MGTDLFIGGSNKCNFFGCIVNLLEGVHGLQKASLHIKNSGSKNLVAFYPPERQVRINWPNRVEMAEQNYFRNSGAPPENRTTTLCDDLSILRKVIRTDLDGQIHNFAAGIDIFTWRLAFHQFLKVR